MNEPAGTGQVPQEGGRQFGMALLAGLVVVVVLASIFYLWARADLNSATHVAPLPMGAAEQAYAPQMIFTDIRFEPRGKFSAPAGDVHRGHHLQ